ncbi:hypothetical protein [Streptomyces sp. NPDC058335]|uniref:hypothetical protein n=1 Tax=Streptomyces sp. NPDC058335 TaxID=3346451 RepID=UPI003669C232
MAAAESPARFADVHLMTEPAPGRYATHDLVRLHARRLAEKAGRTARTPTCRPVSSTTTYAPRSPPTAAAEPDDPRPDHGTPEAAVSPQSGSTAGVAAGHAPGPPTGP